MSPTADKSKVGFWFVGARGAIAVAALAGKAGLATSGTRPGGMLTETAPFDDLPFLEWDQAVFGGCDVVETRLVETLESHLAAHIIPNADRPGVRETVEEVEPRIVNIRTLVAEQDDGDSAPTRLRAIREALRGFRDQTGVERVVVFNCASTEPRTELCQELETTPTWDGLLDVLSHADRPVPWGPLYAAAALLEGCAYVNFTPNLGTDLPALGRLADERGLPHAGKDGKTGETLIKSVLAPLFFSRDLEVLTWQSYNMLGNNDGKALVDPRARASKIQSKDRQLRNLLTNSPSLHTHVAIDFVPSLGDWKTAWNFIHFQGFLGTRMSLHFTWNGCDTALAAPLLLDLARFVELAWRQGETGHLRHLDAYFKSPPDCEDHDFRRQMARLHRHCFPQCDPEHDPECKADP